MEHRLVPGWTLIVPRKETVYHFDSLYRSDCPPVCRSAEDHGWNSWHCLARIPRRKQNDRQAEIIGESHPIGDRTTIEALPHEIVSLIMEYLSLIDHRDVINFGTSSPILWRHALAYLQLDCARSSGALRGMEISLFCDVRYDLPESFKQNDYALIDKILRRRHRDYGPLRTPEELNRLTLSTCCFAELETTPESWMKTLKESVGLHFTRRVGSRLEDDLHWACKIAPFGPCIPDPRVWVLRNLSTMEYVRCRRNERGGGNVLRGEYRTEISVEDVIFWRIQCSDASTGYYGQEYSVTSPMKGTWSGHCLDITLLDDVADELLPLVPEHTEPKWKDVSEETWLDMRHLPIAIARYKARVNEYRAPWYALINDLERYINNMNS